MATKPPQPVQASPQQGLPSVSTNQCLEITRYTLYVFNFIFGVMTWGLTADKVRCYRGNALCDVIIAFGVITMLLLFAIMIWHSFRFFNKPFLPYLIEGITFAVMAVIWLALASAIVAEFKNEESPFGAIKAGGWLAFFTHAGSTAIAFWQVFHPNDEPPKQVYSTPNPAVPTASNYAYSQPISPTGVSPPPTYTGNAAPNYTLPQGAPYSPPTDVYTTSSGIPPQPPVQGLA